MQFCKGEVIHTIEASEFNKGLLSLGALWVECHGGQEEGGLILVCFQWGVVMMEVFKCF